MDPEAFPNSPSDLTPAVQSKPPTNKRKHIFDDGDDDQEFQPAKNPNAHIANEPDQIFDEDGNENFSETEEGARVVSSLLNFFPALISLLARAK